MKQPELAETLSFIAEEGDKYFYQGDFVQKIIKIVNNNQGNLSEEDFKSYRSLWFNPLKIDYKAYRIFMPFGYSNGGIKMGLSLKLLEHFPIAKWGHWSKSAKTLELVTKIIHCVLAEYWIYYKKYILDRKFVYSCLFKSNFLRMLSKLKDSLNNVHPISHSKHTCNVTVIDKIGNIITGNNTIFSMPWSDNPIFIGGTLLNDAGNIALNCSPGSFILDYVSCWISLKENKPINTGGVFGASLYPSDFQLISNLIDFNLPVNSAISLPRIGTFSGNFNDFNFTGDI